MTADTAAKARWFPRQPPAYDGEDDDAYTNRLTGADGGGGPYDHARNRQCSIGWHDECSENNLPELAADAELRASTRHCHCPHHTTPGRLEVQVDDLEEALVAAWSLVRAWDSATGRNVSQKVAEIIRRRPECAC